MTRYSLALFALAPLLAAGCGQPPTATVTGTVRYKGRPVPVGTVTLYCSDKQIVHGLLDGEGRFAIANVPFGPVAMSVQTHRRMPFTAWNAPPAPKHRPEDGPIHPTLGAHEAPPVPIPLRYSHPDESGLTFVADRDVVNFDPVLNP